MIQGAGTSSLTSRVRFKNPRHFREGGDLFIFFFGVGVRADGSRMSQTEAAVFTRSEAQVYSCVQSG